MPVCPQCGAETQQGNVFCAQCGTRLSSLPAKPHAYVPPAGDEQPRRRSHIALNLAVSISAGLVVCGLLISYLSVRNLETESRSVVIRAPTMTTLEVRSRAAKNASYESLARNTEIYVGRAIYYRGKVIQVVEGASSLHIFYESKSSDEYDIWDHTIWVNHQGRRVLDDDIVRVWGIVKGRRTYKSVLGGQITIPEIDAAALEIE